MIYLDYNATVPILPEVIKSLTTAPSGNSHSVHQYGLLARLAERRAEKLIKKYINGHDGYIIWTDSGSQANKLAIEGLCTTSGGLVTSMIEHKSIEDLRRKWGSGLPTLPHGVVDLEQIWRHVNKSTQLVSIMFINNETGIIQPVTQIRELIGNKPFHIDAVQALGKIEIDIEHLQCDLLTLSAHKIGGPKGTGCLWIAPGLDLKLPYLGTRNTPGIIGFGKAIELLNDEDILLRRCADSWFLRTLQKAYPEVVLNSYGSQRMDGTLSLSFPNVDGEELMLALSDEEVMVSTGSACGGKLSHVLTSMGIPDKQIRSTIRVSLGSNHTESQLTKAAEIIASVAKGLNHGP